MRDYRKRQTYQQGDKHMTYYLHSSRNIPCSLGWDENDIKELVREDRNLSVYVRIE